MTEPSEHLWGTGSARALGIRMTANGVASPKRVLKRHRNDYVEWRYPTRRGQSTGRLDLDKWLKVLDSVNRQIRSGNVP